MTTHGSDSSSDLCKTERLEGVVQPPNAHVRAHGWKPPLFCALESPLRDLNAGHCYSAYLLLVGALD